MLRLQAREHSREVERRDRDMLTAVAESGRCPVDGG